MPSLVSLCRTKPPPMLMLNRQMYVQFSALSASDHLDPLRAYLLQNYRLTMRFQTDDELWERLRQESLTSAARLGFSA